MKERLLFKNIILLIGLTVILKGFGFVNRIVIAYFFGTSSISDIYYTASGFSDSISSIMLASISVGVINIYLTNNKNDRRTFISRLLILISILMILGTFLVLLFSEGIAKVLAPGYSKEELNQLSHMLKVMTFTLPFQGFIVVYSSLLQAEKKFTPVKLTGTITSITSIISVIFLADTIGISALVVSYVIGIVINAFFLFICSKKFYKFKVQNRLFDTNIKKMFLLIIPLLIGTAGHEINLIIDRSIASGVSSGAISSLSYSCVLYLFIENVVINSIVTALFPNLTESFVCNNQSSIVESIQKVIYFAECILIPIVICIMFYSTEITKVIYYRGNFDVSSVDMTSAALLGYVLGLPFLAIRDIFTRVYYARGNTRTPVIINLISIIINVFLDIVLSKYIGVLGIALSTSLSILFSSVILFSLQLRLISNIKINKYVKKDFIVLALSIVPIIIINYLTKYINNMFLGIITSAITSVVVLLILLKCTDSVYLNGLISILKKRL